MTSSGQSWLFTRGSLLCDPLMKLMLLGREGRCRRQALAEIVGSRPQRILEVGVATGLNFTDWPAAGFGVGVDLSRQMLRRAARRKEDLRITRIALCQADAERLPFATSVFDAVLLFLFCSQILAHRRIFEEVGRVSAPGATIIIVDRLPSQHVLGRFLERAVDPALGWLRLTLRVDVLSLIREAGWKVVRTIRCGGPFGVMTLLTVRVPG